MREGINCLLFRKKEPLCNDHDIVIDKYGNIHQATGYVHPPSGCYAFLKYKPVSTFGIWFKNNVGYFRVFREYSPQIAHEGLHVFYDARLKTYMPYISSFEINKILKPKEATKKLLYKVKDQLEKDAISLIFELDSFGIPIDMIGLTGSILAGIHNPKISDIDITIHDCKFRKIIEELNLLSPFSGIHLKEWVNKNAKRLGIPHVVAFNSYEPKRRGKYKNRDISITFVAPESLSPDRYYIEGEPLGFNTLIVEVDEIPCESEYFPHVVPFVVRGCIGCKKELSGLYGHLHIYETLYYNLVKNSHIVKVRGKTYINKEGQLKVLIGIKEEKTYVFNIGY